MATKPVQELARGYISTAINVETSPNGVEDKVRKAVDARNGGIFLSRDESIFARDGREFRQPSFFNLDSESLASACDLAWGNLSVFIEVE